MKSISFKTTVTICAAAAVLAVAAGAIAQDGGGRPGQRFQAQGQQGPGMRGPGGGDPAQRQQMIHDQLKLSAAQEPAFKAWQTAMTNPGRPSREDRQDMRNLPTPQRLDRQIAEANERLAELRSRADATRKFYNQLTAEQRTAFDALPPAIIMGQPEGGRGPGARRGPGGRGGFGGPRNFNAPRP